MGYSPPINKSNTEIAFKMWKCIIFPLLVNTPRTSKSKFACNYISPYQEVYARRVEWINKTYIFMRLYLFFFCNTIVFNLYWLQIKLRRGVRNMWAKLHKIRSCINKLHGYDKDLWDLLMVFKPHTVKIWNTFVLM